MLKNQSEFRSNSIKVVPIGCLSINVPLQGVGHSYLLLKENIFLKLTKTLKCTIWGDKTCLTLIQYYEQRRESKGW